MSSPSAGSYEFQNLVPSGSEDEPPDDSAEALAQDSSTRDRNQVRSGSSTKAGSGDFKVRFDKDDMEHATRQTQSNAGSPFPPSFTAVVDHASPSTSTNAPSSSGHDHGTFYGDSYWPTEALSARGLVQDDEYLRSFESGTEATNESVHEHESQQPESNTRQDFGYLREAETLLRAHMPDMHITSGSSKGWSMTDSVLSSILGSQHPTQDSMSTNTSVVVAANGNSHEQGHIVTVNPRGGLFYHILQGYQNPVQADVHKSGKTEEPTTSGRTTPITPTFPSTPTRRKWYKTHSEKPSLEALGHLMESSSKLAVQSVKADIPLETPMLKKRPQAPRTASGKIMSLMGLKRENDTKITAQVAGILQRQKYILKMCLALMLFGAPSHRLEEYLSTTAKVLDMDCQFLYIPGCMIISFDDALTHTTEVKMVRAPQGVNLGKLQDVHLVYKEVLHDIIGMDEALLRLETIVNAKNRWPVWVCIIMYGLASTAVSTFFSARLIDMPIILVLGSLLGILQLVIAPVSNTYNTIFEVSAAILMTFLSRAIASIRGGSLFCFSALAQSSIAMILPGWLVLSSALELHSKAIVPGSIRMVYAIIYSLFLGYGITVGTALFGAISSNATTDTTCHDPLDKYWNFLLVPLYVFFTTFTVQAKWKQMPVMIAIALAGYAVNFYTSQKFAASAPIAYTFGAFVIGVLANLYSRVRHDVAAAILLPAVYVQVPGSLASSGAITVGLQTATLLTQSTNSTASSTDSTQLNALAFNFAASMIQIAIGITVGLFGSALLIYPLGKRRSGLWTL
ncbi:putative Threonine/serine exporter-like N-terminal domain-containing protein [Seiridium unicorne]|uniref:Threonine/serine exporter-like N-terminal domain-containing protein n=1 Tax=Seiridium unicorne TaxID=138068 RepID=A0ABR2UKS8_9PEZI